METAREDLVTIGKIERHFGVRGEFKVRLLSDVPGRLDRLKQVQVLEPTGRTVERTVTHVRRAGSSYIMAIAGVTTPEEAVMLRGGLIQVPRISASTLAADVYFECDLIGMTVEDERGVEVGVLETILEIPENRLFVVRKGTEEVLIPAAKSFVTSVDLTRRRMTVRGIDDLVEGRHEV
ncbi:MAG: 16S rRNA processing protein RimM [Nitrospira sp.]|nr:16S rRNA processing protein RimM [Nitrospira sp.]TKB75876.1 MAG: 16S rRNA processing protein RimM [Nitrospira sp.]